MRIVGRSERLNAARKLLVGSISLLLGSIWSLSAQALPYYGVELYMSVDAGRAHDFTNRVLPQTVATGDVTLAVTDNARGGAQAALTTAYASVGSLGGKLLTSTAGALLEIGQAFDDLSWYTNFLVTGTPGTKVSYQISTGLDGYTAGAGTAFSGGVHATTFVANTLLADHDFNLYINPGPFNVLTSKIYTFDVGQTVYLTSRMTVGGHADIDSIVDIDAFSTSRFFVDTLTAGGGYSTDAGVTFATLIGPPSPPTPGVAEPTSLSLLTAGLVLLAIARPRRKSSVGRSKAAHGVR